MKKRATKKGASALLERIQEIENAQWEKTKQEIRQQKRQQAIENLNAYVKARQQIIQQLTMQRHKVIKQFIKRGIRNV